LITHKQEGWVVPKRDVQAMADQVLNFSKLQDDEIKRIKLAAREKVEVQHNEKKMVEDMMNLYKEVNGLD
jgi:colanic acid/amylovoran biosynthesis glycosyltransferase